MEMKVAAAFVKAQKAFSPALKSSTNPHFRSKYADLAACVEAVLDALNDNGIGVIQRTKLCDDGVIVETVFLHESGEKIECGDLHVPAGKNDPQGYGSALTYARRYSLMAACGIAPEDDDGNAAKAPQPKPESAKSVAQTAWEAEDEESQAYLRNLADDIKGLLALPDTEQAVGKLEEAKLSADEKAAIWFLFDSKQRAAIKAESKKEA